MNSAFHLISYGVIAGFFLTACSSAPVQRSTTIEVLDKCIGDRSSLLALDIEQFDRTLGEGWRPIAEIDGCEIAAADLVAEYRETRIDADDSRSLSSLTWHEGQTRAAAGQTEHAIDLFSDTFRETTENDADVAWNLYVGATIAFLNQDRLALDNAHRAMLALPEPDFWAAAVEQTRKKYGFTPVWPNNLNVVEAFQRCFEKSYAEAYSECNKGLSD